MSDNPILDLEQQLRSAHVRLQGQPLARCVGERQPRFGWPGAGDRKRRGFRRWRALPVLAALLVMGGAATAAVILSSQKSGPLAGQLPPAWSVGQLPSNRYELERAPAQARRVQLGHREVVERETDDEDVEDPDRALHSGPTATRLRPRLTIRTG